MKESKKRPTIILTLWGFAGFFAVLWLAYDATFNGLQPLHWKVLAAVVVTGIATYPNGRRLKKWAESH